MRSQFTNRPAAARAPFVVCAFIVVAMIVATSLRSHAASPSTRAAVVSAATLEAPDGIRRALAAAAAAGVTTIVAPAPVGARSGPDRFLDLLQQAHDRQLQVYASIDLDRVALADEVPGSRNTVVYDHPEWLMVPRALAPELLPLDVRSPEYVGRLARWTRAHGVDGVYLSPLPDEAASFVAGAAAALLRRYAVDGVQLDAARYPTVEFDYGRRALDAFRQNIRPTLAAADRSRVDADETIDPFAYPNAFPDEWRRFRQNQLTRLVAQVRAAITSALPGIPVVAAVSGPAETDLETHLQDWRSWMERRLIDAISVRTGAMTTILSDVTALVTVADAASTSSSR